MLEPEEDRVRDWLLVLPRIELTREDLVGGLSFAVALVAAGGGGVLLLPY